MTYDGGEMKLYLDGELKDSLEPNGTLDDKNDQCLFFGAELDSSGCSRHSGTYADVTIDEVLIYDHALDYDAPIPTLSEWGIIIFMTIMMGIGVVIIYRRRIV